MTQDEIDLIAAINRADQRTIGRLINANKNLVNCIDDNGLTPLQHAMDSGSLNLVFGLIVVFGARIRTQSELTQLEEMLKDEPDEQKANKIKVYIQKIKESSTPLLQGTPQTAVTKKTAVLQNDQDFPPLHRAIKQDNKQEVIRLLNEGHDPNEPNSRGISAYNMCGNDEITEKLIMHMESMPQNQRWIQYKMKQMGYEKIDMKGVCNGISNMAGRAFLAGGMNRFNERLRYIQHTPWEQLESKVDVKAFFDGVYVCQFSYDDSLQHLFPNSERPSDSDVNQLLDDNDAIYEGETQMGAYTHEELVAYLRLLESNLSVPTSIMIKSLSHAITINYDKDKRTWFFIDPVSLPAKPVTDPAELASLIMGSAIESYSDKTNKDNVAVISTQLKVAKENQQQLIQDQRKLAQNPTWMALHQPNPERAARQDKKKNTLLHLAIRYKNDALVKQLIEMLGNKQKNEHGEVHPLNSSDTNNTTPLFHYIWYEPNVEMIALLIQHGAELNEKHTLDGKECSLLDIAIDSDNEALAKVLIENGIPIQNWDQLVDVVTSRNWENVIDVLIKRGLYAHITDPERLAKLPKKEQSSVETACFQDEINPRESVHPEAGRTLPTLSMQEKFKVQKGINASMVNPDAVLLSALIAQHNQKCSPGARVNLSDEQGDPIVFVRDEESKNSTLETPDYILRQKGTELDVYERLDGQVEPQKETAKKEAAISKVFGQLYQANQLVIIEAHLYHVKKRLADLFENARLALKPGDWKSPGEIKDIIKNYKFDAEKEWKFGRTDSGNYAFRDEKKGYKLEFEESGEISVSKDGSLLFDDKRVETLESFSAYFRHITNAEAKIEEHFDLVLEEHDSPQFPA
ncbi:ankyrin repeat domain-containing protein [Legionella sp. W05-934-2]|uniref:ankyrin repeat domain-containing protein n=1 Tax=Legionella sp. W05-934-2 TaxID=1198649 RepID=UPI0034618EBB